MTDQAGLEPGTRYRCEGCGNLTRFDIEAVEHVRRFWHVELSGVGRMETEDRLDVDVRSVTCRWCGPGAPVEIVEAPAGVAGVAGRPQASSGTARRRT